MPPSTYTSYKRYYMKKLLSSLFYILVSITLSYGFPLQAVEKLIEDNRVIKAKPLVRKSPKYPTKASLKMQEGWVIINFIIDKHGTVVDPFIERSSGIKDFERSALRAVKKWTYIPATQNGQPIEQYQRTVKLDFRIREGAGVSNKFFKSYSSLIESIDSNELDTAKKKLKKLYNKKLWNYTESSYYWLADAIYSEAIKDDKRELNSINNALATKSEQLQDTNISYLLARQFILNYRYKRLSNALKSLNVLKSRAGNEELVAQLQPYAETIQFLIKGNKPLIRTILLESERRAVHQLIRNDFSVVVNKGSLSEIEVRCDNKRSKYGYKKENIWKIPKSWGKCDVVFFGKKYSSIDIVEY